MSSRFRRTVLIPALLLAAVAAAALVVATTRDGRGRPLQLHNGGVTGMAVSPDGATIAVGGDDGTVVLRRLTAG